MKGHRNADIRQVGRMNTKEYGLMCIKRSPGIIALLFVLIFSGFCRAEVAHVSLQSQPDVEGGFFSAIIDWWDYNSREPNICYKHLDYLRGSCYYAMFVVKVGAVIPAWNATHDQDAKDIRSGCATAYKTMGDVGKCLRDKGVLRIMGQDRQPFGDPKGFILCVFPAHAIGHGMIYPNPISNCEAVVLPPTGCDITEPSFEFDFGTVRKAGKEPIPDLEKPLHIKCTGYGSGSVYVSGNRIMLGEKGRAIFNILNGGWDKPGRFSIRGGGIASGTIKARIQDLREIGDWSGSSIIVLQPD